MTTQAEEARQQNLKRVRHELLTNANTGNAYSLNLSLLPVETKARMCVLNVEEDVLTGDYNLVVEDDGTTLKGDDGVLDNQVSLRQMKFMNMSPKQQVHTLTEEAGIEMKMSRGTGRIKTVALDMEGMSMSMRVGPINIARAHEIGGVVFDRKEWLKSLHTGRKLHPFIGQHTIKFPALFKDREGITFLGLPRGSVLPMKNGAEFEVVRRENVFVDVNNVTTGHLLVKALNDKAIKSAEAIGWSKTKEGLFLIPPELDTEGAYKFMVKDIVIPFRDPTKEWRAYFAKEATLQPNSIGNGVKRRAAGNMVYHETKEALIESLDDFLFA